jgi:antirestriction protein ArdC
MTTIADTEWGHLPCTANEVTGADYQGKNVLRLFEATVGNGYDPEHGWAGFTQWRTIGRTVRKGEHGTPCLTVVTVDRDESGRGTTKPREFRVFHFDQTDPLPDRES